MVDDYQAIANLYSIRFGKRFVDHPLSVLFVDLGATATKAYRIAFRMNKTLPVANTTSYEFVEYSNMESALPDISSVIRRAFNRPVDVVQVFGGGSRSDSALEAVREAVGPGIEIKKELPGSEAIALGAAYRLQEIVGSSAYMLPNMTHTSAYNSWIECSNHTENYCVKGEGCEQGAIFDYSYCEELVIRTSDAETPVGASSILGRYALKNVSEFRNGKTSGGMILLKAPFPVIEAVLWCTNKDMDCLPIHIEPVDELPVSRMLSLDFAFVEAVAKGAKERKKLGELRVKIDLLLEQLENSRDEDTRKIVEDFAQILKGDVSEGKLEVIAADLTMHVERKNGEL
jgi:hypothetical protein